MRKQTKKKEKEKTHTRTHKKTTTDKHIKKLSQTAN